jgi:hypothetical protein
MVREKIIENKIAVFAIILLVILDVALFGPMLYHQMRPESGSDFNGQRGHIEHVKKMMETKTITAPHFLFHLLVIGTYALEEGANAKALLPPQYRTKDFLIQLSGFIVTFIFYVLLSIILYSLIRSTFDSTISLKVSLFCVLIAICLMIVMPVNMFSLPSHQLYLGYIGINVYHSPTMVLLKPLSIMLFLCATQLFCDLPNYRFQTGTFRTGVYAILSTLAKPSYIICLLPAVFFLSIYRHFKKQRVDWKLMILGIVIPSALTLVWQYVFTYLLNILGKRQIIFSPFGVMSFYSSWLIPKFILSILFPLIIYFLYFEKAKRNIILNLSWLIFLIGTFYTYFMAEGGGRFSHGNFTWSGEISLFILFVISTSFFLHQNSSFILNKDSWKPNKKFLIGSGVFGMHLLSGILWYYVQLTSNPDSLWW